jgi:hypothetical protein
MKFAREFLAKRWSAALLIVLPIYLAVLVLLKGNAIGGRHCAAR